MALSIILLASAALVITAFYAIITQVIAPNNPRVWRFAHRSALAIAIPCALIALAYLIPGVIDIIQNDDAHSSTLLVVAAYFAAIASVRFPIPHILFWTIATSAVFFAHVVALEQPHYFPMSAALVITATHAAATAAKFTRLSYVLGERYDHRHVYAILGIDAAAIASLTATAAWSTIAP